MSRIVFDDEKAWPKIGQIVSFCTDSTHSTGWVLAIFLGRESPEHRLTTCMLFIDKSSEIKNDIHYTRLDTDLLEYDYKRNNNNPCNEIVLTPTNNIVNVIQTT